MKVNGQGGSRLGQGRHSWQWEKHAWIYSDLLLALKGRTFVSSVFFTDGNLISASALPHCGYNTAQLYPQVSMLLHK